MSENKKILSGFLPTLASRSAMIDAALTNDFLQNALRDASDRLRALAAIALDPDVPSVDQDLARNAVVQHLSGAHAAIVVADQADGHLQLEADLRSWGQTRQAGHASLATAIVTALPRTAPAPAVTMPGRIAAAFFVLLAVAASTVIVVLMPRFMPLTAGTAAILVGVLAASCRQRAALAELAPRHLAVAAAGLGGLVVLTGLLVNLGEGLGLLSSTLFAWTAFAGGLVGLVASWSSARAPGRALVLRALAAAAVVAGHGLLGL